MNKKPTVNTESQVKNKRIEENKYANTNHKKPGVAVVK